MNKPIVKSSAEIEQMRRANGIVARALKTLEAMIAPGVTTGELDEAAEAIIREEGAEPAFLGYPCPTPDCPVFPASICASVNEEVVHGIPGARRLEEGQILSIDIGAICGGYVGDAARTFAVGEVTKKAAKLLETGRLCLQRATEAMRPGATLMRIAEAIQRTAESRGYSVVRQFVGHGIGRDMHEPPQVLNYVSPGLAREDVELPVGTVLAIEPMVNLGGPEVRVQQDGWTVVTKDRSLSVHFEDTVAITEDGPLVLTEY